MDGDSSYEGNFVLATLVDNESSAPSSQHSGAEVEAAASKSTKKHQKGKQDKRWEKSWNKTRVRTLNVGIFC